MHRSVLRGIVLILVAAAVIIALILLPKPPTKKPRAANLDPWKLVSYDPDNPYGTYLGNGFISTRIMGDGVGSQNGKPLPCYMAGLYDDEKLIPIPTWSDLRFYDGKTQFKIDKSADYKQTLDMKAGILTTEATWRAASKTLKGKIEVIVSRAEPNVGLVKATMMPNFEGDLWAVVFVSKPESPGLTPVIDGFKTNHGWGPAPQIAWGSYQTSSGGTFVGLAGSLDSDAFSHLTPTIPFDLPALSLPLSVSSSHRFAAEVIVAAVVGTDQRNVESASRSWVSPSVRRTNQLISDHKAAWAKLWEKDIIIDGPRKDQQAIHSCMFYLLQSVREGGQWSIPPMGLSNNAFSGHVFWDADLWMFPALILQQPELARVVVDYRYNTLPGAMANAKAGGYAGAEYAWESGYTGKEDTPEGLPYRYERHINGDIALAQWQYYLATGDLDWLTTRGYPVLKATADYWASRAKYVPEKRRYEILQVVPPDENAELVDNSVYTNAVARMNLELAGRAAKLVGAAANPKWADVAAKMYIPFDGKNQRFIAFDGYKGLQAKQADTELLAYPLQFKIPGKDMTGIYRNTYSFYAPRVLVNGPAMTSSVHSVIAARLGDRGKAYREFLRSYRPFFRGPFNYFNEKRSRTVDNMCFLTGAAGPVQAALFGLAGLRMDYYSENPELTRSACLPKEWRSLKVTGVQWRGKKLDVVVER